MKNRFLIFLFAQFILLMLTSASTSLSAESGRNEYVTARLLTNVKGVIPGRPFLLGVELTMKPGWHTYYKKSGDAGLPTKISWHLPSGFQSGKLLWEKPYMFSDSGITTYGYTGKNLIAAQITSPSNLPIGKKLDFGAQVEWLSCKDICVPGKAELHLTLPIVSQRTANGLDYLSVNSPEFVNANFEHPDNGFNVLETSLTGEGDSYRHGKLLIYFAFAVLGGLLLNAMPCVLPVVAIKILSLLEQSKTGNTRATTIAFAAGILSSFLLLGLLVVSLQAAGQKVGWGFQFQQPIFLMLMSCLILVFALSLFGLFDLSISFGQKPLIPCHCKRADR